METAPQDSAGEGNGVPAAGKSSLVDLDTWIPALDGLRAIAILLVFFFHAVHPWKMQDSMLSSRFWEFVGGVSRIGWMGVDVFFVLSGFLITGILLRTRDTPHYFRNFYARRTLRIFPMYYAALLLAHVAIPLAMGKFKGLPASLPWDIFYLGNFFQAFETDLVRYSLVWSLCVEEHFYLLWPLLVRKLDIRNLKRAAVFLLLSAPLIRTAVVLDGRLEPHFVYVTTFCRWDSMAMGALVAILLREPRWRGILSGAAMPWTLASGVLLAGIFAYAWITSTIPLEEARFIHRQPIVTTIGHSVVALFSAALIVLALRPASDSGFARMLTLKPMLSIGKHSYAIYLLHYFVVMDMPWFGAWRFQKMFPPELDAVPHLIYVVFLFGVSWLAAKVAWVVLENPCLKLKRFFEYDERGGTKAPAR